MEPTQNSDQDSLHQLEVTNELYQTIFDNSAIAIMIANDREQIISWNKFTEDLLGKTREDLYLKPVRSLYPEQEWEKMRALNIRKYGNQRHLETKIFRKDGNVIDVDISISPWRDLSGKVIGSIGILKDITERKKAERDIAEAYQMKKDFASMVSHELKTPITTIHGSLDIVLDGSAGAINDEQKDFLTTAKKNVNRLERQISDVLDYQKLMSSDFELQLDKGDINIMVERINAEMSALAQSKGLYLKTSLSTACPEFHFDHKRIEQVIRNLVENAIKFTERGYVTILTKVEEDMIQLSVQDNGIGIKKGDLNKIYKIFGQLSTGTGRLTGSTGLGLIISKIIVEKHGGRIWTESEYGKGSTFLFLLPISDRK